MAKAENKYDLVIVESPAKAKTIGGFLGNNFIVKSSYGHIRDLKKNNFGVDIEHNYAPEYIIPDDKKDVVAELKKLSGKATNVWLASDEDREGEAISWHLAEVLGLNPETTKRIVFHEITKGAINNAIENPRTIDMNLVDAQQARRVLDRLVGFELSPVLWRKVKPALSAGRVQSVAVRILVEREREIFAFVAQSSFQTQAQFKIQNTETKAELDTRFDNKALAQDFLERCKNVKFSILGTETKPYTRYPAPPFTTSTLQQEASRKLSMSVSQTMTLAQKLYEAGLITYMRTDSVNLAETAIKNAAAVIDKNFGKEYLYIRRYKTKSKGAQEAHEAIRPTDFNRQTIDGTQAEKRLYELIWKRAIASQMADAQLEKTTITIGSKALKEKFVTAADTIKFDGFLKLYVESTDSDDSEESTVIIPQVTVGEEVTTDKIISREKWSQRPARYSEASLVRKLEELGIGRPSTYAPTISTIQQRGYVVKENRQGEIRKYQTLTLKNGKISDEVKEETFGAEKGKLFPTDIGMIVNDFLIDHFKDVMDFDFTAKVEKQFDDIAEGHLKWQNVIDEFYRPFHEIVEDTLEKSHKNTGERELGIDPKSGKKVIVRVGRFGPIAQIGESSDETEKPRFASLRHGQHLETITLDEALSLFELPRNIGQYEGKDVTIGIGRFGPYIRHDGKFISLKRNVDDPYTIDLDTAIERIGEKRDADSKKLIREFAEDESMKVLNGRWGPYIAFDGNNYKIPKGKDAAKLTYADCKAICDEQKDKVKTKEKPQKAAKATTAKTTKTVAAKNEKQSKKTIKK
ncbi:MAG: type I DNA topoisomerase [Bacteroidales bacterium]|nr:type I DNA topoisomerase [Bacteroidales bacterium]